MADVFDTAAALGAGTATGQLTQAQPLSGVGLGAGVATGTLYQEIPLAALAVGLGTSTGQLYIDVRLAGTAVGAGIASGLLEPTYTIGAYGAGTITGLLLVQLQSFVGLAVGAGTATGQLQLSVELAGKAIGTGTPAFTGTVEGEYQQPGWGLIPDTARGTGTVAADMGCSLTGQVSAFAYGIASGRIIYPCALQGQATGTGTASGMLVPWSNVDATVAAVGLGICTGVLSGTTPQPPPPKKVNTRQLWGYQKDKRRQRRIA